MKNKKIVIILIICLSLLLIILGVFLASNNSNKPKKNKENKTNNSYKISKNQEELENTQIVETDNLKAPHCIDNICISNVVMYYADKRGRVTYTITNNSNEIISGRLKMNFGSDYIIVSYQDIKMGEMFEDVSYFDDKSFEKVDDYKLEKLTDSEKSKIIVSK